MLCHFILLSLRTTFAPSVSRWRSVSRVTYACHRPKLQVVNWWDNSTRATTGCCFFLDSKRTECKEKGPPNTQQAYLVSKMELGSFGDFQWTELSTLAPVFEESESTGLPQHTDCVDQCCSQLGSMDQWLEGGFGAWSENWARKI